MNQIEESEFIRKSWNEQTPPDEFARMISNQYPSNLESITIKLIELCGQDTAPFPYLLQYLMEILQNQPLLLCSLMSNLKDTYIVGFIRLFHVCGDILFNTLEIGVKESAECALNVLKIVITYPDLNLVKETMLKISRSQIFSIIVASARVFAYEQLIQIRQQIQTMNLFEVTQNNMQMTHSILMSALFKDHLTNPRVSLTQQPILCLVVSSTHYWMLSDALFHMVQNQLIRPLFYMHLSSFFRHPTISLAYVLSNCLLHYLPWTDNEEKESIDHDYKSFDRAKLESFIRKYHQINFISDVSYGYNGNDKMFNEEDSFQYLPIGLSADETIDYLCAWPDTIDNNRIIDITLQYPAFSSKLPSYVMNLISYNTKDQAILMCTQIIPEAYDFLVLLLQQQMYTEFMNKLIELIRQLKDNTDFEKAWICFLTLLQTAWRSGSTRIRLICEKMIENHDIKLQSFLNSFLNKPQRHIDNSFTIEDIIMYSTPFLRSLEFFEFLFSFDKGTMDEVTQLLQDHQYLWPSALAWGIESCDRSALLLSKAKVPNYEIVTFLYHHMMNIIVSPMNSWQTALEMPDYDMAVKLKPKSINDLQYRIIDDLNSIFNKQTFNDKAISTIIILWRAWAHIFGVSKFVKTLLSLLMWESQSNSDVMVYKHLFQSSGFLLVIACDEDPDMIYEVLKAATEMLDESTDIVIDGDGLAQFCLFVVLSVKPSYEVRFQYLMEICQKMITEDSQTSSSRISFAEYLTRISLYIPQLQNLISPELFKLFVLKHDWQTAMDFFIAKGHALNPESVPK